jgi:hypothetical protein
MAELPVETCEPDTAALPDICPACKATQHPSAGPDCEKTTADAVIAEISDENLTLRTALAEAQEDTARLREALAHLKVEDTSLYVRKRTSDPNMPWLWECYHANIDEKVAYDLSAALDAARSTDVPSEG